MPAPQRTEKNGRVQLNSHLHRHPSSSILNRGSLSLFRDFQRSTLAQRGAPGGKGSLKCLCVPKGDQLEHQRALPMSLWLSDHEWLVLSCYAQSSMLGRREGSVSACQEGRNLEKGTRGGGESVRGERKAAPCLYPPPPGPPGEHQRAEFCLPGAGGSWLPAHL